MAKSLGFHGSSLVASVNRLSQQRFTARVVSCSGRARRPLLVAGFGGSSNLEPVIEKPSTSALEEREVRFVDICADDYSAEENGDIGYEKAMGGIHAIRDKGEVLTSIAAFRALYEEVGLGWVYAITKYEPWASIIDKVYDFWAKYRLPITGRPPLAAVLEKRRQMKMASDKRSAEGRCRLD